MGWQPRKQHFKLHLGVSDRTVFSLVRVVCVILEGMGQSCVARSRVTCRVVQTRQAHHANRQRDRISGQTSWRTGVGGLEEGAPDISDCTTPEVGEGELALSVGSLSVRV